MVARGYDPAVAGFDKIEGIIAGPHRRSLYMSESGATGKPGAVWRFTQLSDQGAGRPGGARGQLCRA